MKNHQRRRSSTFQNGLERVKSVSKSVATSVKRTLSNLSLENGLRPRSKCSNSGAEVDEFLDYKPDPIFAPKGEDVPPVPAIPKEYLEKSNGAVDDDLLPRHAEPPSGGSQCTASAPGTQPSPGSRAAAPWASTSSAEGTLAPVE
jgi:hypothetical protein